MTHIITRITTTPLNRLITWCSENAFEAGLGLVVGGAILLSLVGLFFSLNPPQ